MRKIYVIAACAAFCLGFASYGNFQALEILREKLPSLGTFRAETSKPWNFQKGGLPNLGSFVEIPGGTFSMGSREGRECEQSRDVTVEPFLMLDHEVTGEEYAECAGTSSSKKKRPAASVSYSEAVGYCEWLSQECGRRVRLPTEEEWERAARGGIRKARYPWGWNPPEGRACFDVSEAADVRSYDANPYGLYDMSGSVFEWCASSDVSNAIARGGAWSERQPEMLTVFRRTKFPKDYADADVGFRVVVEIENNLPTP